MTAKITYQTTSIALSLRFRWYGKAFGRTIGCYGKGPLHVDDEKTWLEKIKMFEGRAGPKNLAFCRVKLRS